MSICDLEYNQTAYIQTLTCRSALTKRLLALGCIPGTPIQLKQTAPLGDPLIVHFRGFDVALRKKDASAIYVTLNQS